MLTKDQLLHSLARLGQELEAMGLEGELLLTGGASMCLVHSARDMTKDIDALYEPKEIINDIAGRIAEEAGLEEGWINDSVKGFVEPTAGREDFMTLPGLRISTVSTDYLLAMKLIAARYGEKDREDVQFLAEKLGLETPEQMHDVLLKYYPPERIMPRTGYLIEEVLEDIRMAREQTQSHEQTME